MKLTRLQLREIIKEELQSLNEAKKVEVAARVGRVATDVFNDSYRKLGKQTSTLTFKFNKKEDYQNFIDDLKAVGVKSNDIF